MNLGQSFKNYKEMKAQKRSSVTKARQSKEVIRKIRKKVEAKVKAKVQAHLAYMQREKERLGKNEKILKFE